MKRKLVHILQYCFMKEMRLSKLTSLQVSPAAGGALGLFLLIEDSRTSIMMDRALAPAIVSRPEIEKKKLIKYYQPCDYK